MVKIWRVENNKGKGCYWKQPTEMVLKRHINRLTHPTPVYDIGIERAIKTKEICGFVNKQQASDWFNENELMLLLAFDFRLKEIEVTKITVRGQKQILATR